MKCPYQTKVIHKPELNNGYTHHYAEDITEFGECLKEECPFYYTTVTEHCRKAEREGKE